MTAGCKRGHDVPADEPPPPENQCAHGIPEISVLTEIYARSTLASITCVGQPMRPMDTERPQDTSPSPLPPLTQRLVLHWGEMGSRWGMNRTVSQVHALLYLSERPLDAEEIAASLQVARSNVSTSLRELASWKLVRVVHRIGDRRDHFATLHDPWEVFRTSVRERKAREFDPTIDMLRECLGDPGLEREAAFTRTRMRDTLALMESLSAWSEEMLTLQTSTLGRIMKLGARVAKFLHPASRSPASHARTSGKPTSGSRP